MVYLLKEINAIIVIQLRKRLIHEKSVGGFVLFFFFKSTNLEKVNNGFFFYLGTKLHLFPTQSERWP